MTQQATTNHPPGASLHLGGQAWCAPALEPLLVPVDQVRPYPGNPRRHDQDNITGSIRELGMWAAVTVQASSGNTLVGNGRMTALLELGAEYAPAIPYDVDDSRAAAIVARDNQTSDASSNDEALLLALLEGMDAEARVLSGYADEDMEAMRRALAAAEYVPPVVAPTLMDRFLVAPFSVLDARSGVWQERKRRWLALGIESELGRDAALLGGSLPAGGKGAAMAAQLAGGHSSRKHDGVIGNGLPTPQRGGFQSAERAARQRVGAYGAQATTDPVTGWLIYETTTGATSIFDPVVAELAMRWFCPPGGTVLDPFAGGSVRGIVASALGHPYVGVELRDEQVQANRTQAQSIVPRLKPARLTLGVEPTELPPDNTPELTPLETHGGHLVKRDDLYRRAGQRGGKVRTCWALATADPKPEGLVTASSRQSPQAIIVAHIAQALGIGCRLHMPSGAYTPEMEACEAAGAELVQHRPGRNTVIVKRARDDAASSGWRLIPFGMECDEAVLATSAQVGSIGDLHVGDMPARIVIPVGSGMSLAGLLTGLAELELGEDQPSVLGVVVGADPTARLDEYAPEGWRSMGTLVMGDSPYEEPAAERTLGDLELDAHYEAKCLPHLQPGDLLWVVGNRAQPERTRPVALGNPTPVWHQGDSREVLGKTHQQVLVFCKGDPKAATEACGTVEVVMPEVTE